MKNVNLVESLFSKNYHFESGIFCTYGLNLNFFENYLMKLNSFYSCDDLCVFTDSGTYDGFIAESYSPRWLNKKYLVNRIKSNGVFHPKLYMFASEKKAVVGIGSANLTRDGIASNLELLSVFEVSEKNQTYSHLLSNCIEYVRLLAQITKSKKAIDQIDTFNQICKSYLHNQEAVSVKFVHNLSRPIIKTIIENLEGLDVSKIQVLSPFYDTKLAPFETLRDAFPESEFEIYLQQKKSNFPKDQFDNFKLYGSLFLYENIERYMHGKTILIHASDKNFLFTGSANFTRSALLEIPPSGNYEIGLWGSVDHQTAESLFSLNGGKIIKVTEYDEIETGPSSDFEGYSNRIEYIDEAVLKNNIISIAVNKDVSLDNFLPTKYILRNFNSDIYEGNIEKEFNVKLPKNINKIVPGKISIQLLGRDKFDNQLESNILWVIELEEKDAGSNRRRFRRIYNDPFELMSVLTEILEGGDKEELRLFLLQFDVPLDLLLPPRKFQKYSGTKSKGNIEGELAAYNRYIFSMSVQDAYTECLKRLYRKLESHLENPQVIKIDNFVTIFASFCSLIGFVGNELIYNNFKNGSIVSPGEWSSIRDYYNMLLMNIDHSWKLVWAKGGFRDKINAKVTIEQQDNHLGDLANFEEYISEQYSSTFDELITISSQAVENFEELLESLSIRTIYGKNVKASISSNRDIYLQPEFLAKTKSLVQQVAENCNLYGVA